MKLGDCLQTSTKLIEHKVIWVAHSLPMKIMFTHSFICIVCASTMHAQKKKKTFSSLIKDAAKTMERKLANVCQSQSQCSTLACLHWYRIARISSESTISDTLCVFHCITSNRSNNVDCKLRSNCVDCNRSRNFSLVMTVFLFCV